MIENRFGVRSSAGDEMCRILDIIMKFGLNLIGIFDKPEKMIPFWRYRQVGNCIYDHINEAAKDL